MIIWIVLKTYLKKLQYNILMYITHEQFINKPPKKKTKYVYSDYLKEYGKQPKIKCMCGSNTVNLDKHLKSSLHLTNVIKNHL